MEVNIPLVISSTVQKKPKKQKNTNCFLNKLQTYLNAMLFSLPRHHPTYSFWQAKLKLVYDMSAIITQTSGEQEASLSEKQLDISVQKLNFTTAKEKKTSMLFSLSRLYVGTASLRRNCEIVSVTYYTLAGDQSKLCSKHWLYFSEEHLATHISPSERQEATLTCQFEQEHSQQQLVESQKTSVKSAGLGFPPPPHLI